MLVAAKALSFAECLKLSDVAQSNRVQKTRKPRGRVPMERSGNIDLRALPTWSLNSCASASSRQLLCFPWLSPPAQRQPALRANYCGIPRE